MPAERLAPPEFGQPRILRKGADANDGVVAPVIALGAVPPRDPRGQQRAIQPSCELLPARKQRFRVDDDRQRLNQRDLRMRLHGGSEANDAIAGHQTVGVQDQHALIVGAEPPDPVLDIA